MGHTLTLIAEKDNEGYYPSTENFLKEAAEKITHDLRNRFPRASCEAKVVNANRVSITALYRNTAEPSGYIWAEMSRLAIEYLGVESLSLEFRDSY